MKIILLLILAFIATTANAQSELEKSCSKFYERTPALNYYRQFLTPDFCFISVTPQDTISMIFRSYLFSNTGAFMVFNSYGHGEDAKNTGARVYYFFPRTNIPERKLAGNKLSIQTSSPTAIINFNGKTGEIESMNNSNFSVASQINAQNQGGVEIKTHKGLMLDVGFAQGHDPSLDKARIVKFQDHLGTQCTMRADEIFTYVNGDALLPTDTEMKVFLSSRCPTLKLLF